MRPFRRLVLNDGPRPAGPPAGGERAEALQQRALAMLAAHTDAHGREHGILRGNRRRPFSPWRPFCRGDARRRLAMTPPDPRIHFAITCGAASCPPVGVYRAEAIDAQLDLAARNFVNQEVVVDGRGRVVCSRLFKWYAGDFAADGGLGRFLLRHLDDGPVKAALAAGAPPCAKYRAYSWALQHPPAE